MEHIAKSDFLAFFTKADRPLYARIAGHLLGGCPACFVNAKQALLGPSVAVSLTSSRALAVVILEEAALLKEERSKAAVRWARVADLDEEQRLVAVKDRRGLRNYGLAVYVLDEAEALATRGKSSHAAELVRFSAAVGDRLPARVYGASPLTDLELRQHTTLANIRRLQLDFPGALAALGRAEKVYASGFDPAEVARFFRVKASLLTDLGDFEEAGLAASRAGGLYSGMLDFLSQGKATVQEALCVKLFDPRKALCLANEALPLLAREPKSLLLANYTKCYCLAKLGQSEEAESLLASQRESIRQVAEVEPDLWFRYVEALILKAKGNANDADALLLFVALRFREEGKILPMLRQHLERIRIKAETGRWRAAVNIAARLTPELARLGLRADLLGMWASLQDALAQGQNVVNEIENLFLRRWNSPRPPARQISR